MRKTKEEKEYPGIAKNVADKNANQPSLRREDVRELNNNPRNTDNHMP